MIDSTNTKPSEEPDAKQFVQLRMHPRVFAALGKDLVTNDVVAVMELVKNAYDAFAENVWITFYDDAKHGPCLEIIDDGMGMTRDIIENVWCLVATPYRENNSVTKKGDKERRVVGAKGLGRLSVARLGNRLTMQTQAAEEPCWEVEVDWLDISGKDDLAHSTVACREVLGLSPFSESGTSLRIQGLTEKWDDGRIGDLRENLARLLSPFAETNDFNIFLSTADGNGSEDVRIQSPEFLSGPKYKFEGEVDELGNVTGTYRFAPIVGRGGGRTRPLQSSWYNIRESIPRSDRARFPADAAGCGPFSFEIRAWDIDSGGTREISSRFKVQRGLVRRAIRAHKGVSVYRDGILVLPKSENSRDWLGLDLRRVGRVGPRLSTSQIVGYVAITGEGNPGIVDTSDRERLSSSIEVGEFEEILRAIVRMLEGERNRDRTKPGGERPMAELFGGISAQELLANVSDLAEEGAPASDVLPLVQSFGDSLDETRRTIEERFVYYSRLATVGTIAQYLVHEIRNRTTAFGSILRSVRNSLDPSNNPRVARRLLRGEEAVDALEHLADTFAPLANRQFTRRIQGLILEDRIWACLEMNEAEIQGMQIKCCVPKSQTVVMADPADLYIILYNLITNAAFWLGEVPAEKRRIEFELEALEGPAEPRINVTVHDTGPGIDSEDIEQIFLPGVTRKPDGIGMGLTVASELVALYGGEMRAARQPTKTGGASFMFDLPTVADGKED